MNLFIGQPVKHRDAANDRDGYIVNISDTENKTYIIGAGMKEITKEIVIAWNEGETSLHDEYSVQRFVDTPTFLDPISAEEAAAKQREAEQRRDDRMEKARADAAEAQKERDKFVDFITPKIPAKARAVIIAEQHIDDSDVMTDYFGHKTGDVILLAWSNHTRDLFPEMRKAALNAEETAHMSESGDEHREKYSMGGGYYLSEAGNWRHSTGWVIRKVPLAWNKADEIKPENVPSGRYSIPEATKAAPVQSSTAVESVEVREGTKAGYSEILFPDKPGEDVRDELKAAGFRWSRFNKCWYGKTDNLPARYTAAESLPVVDNKPADINQADKLRALADKMQSQIDDKLANRLTNTPKRLAQANHARVEGEKLQRTQTVLYKLADLHDAGEVPAILLEFKSKKAVYDLMGERLEPVANGFHTYYTGTGTPAKDGVKVLALWQLLEAKSDEQKQAEELQRSIEGLQFSNIPDYYPTPDDVIDRMLTLGAITEGDNVLEPSAGHGAIADKLRDKGASVTCIECNHTLAGILEKKGHDVYQGDFLNFEDRNTYDAIVMNPPFSKYQDIKHVKQALKVVKRGGLVVAIVAGGPRQVEELQPLAEYWEPLPAGTFKEAGTMVNTVLSVFIGGE